MSFLDDWRTLSARIHGLNEAARLDATLRPGAPGPTGSTRFLQAQAAEIFGELRLFHQQYHATLPSATVRLLEQASKLASPTATDPARTPEINRGTAGSDLVHLQPIESAVTFSLASSEARVYSLTERAFQHLQRSLIADDDLRARWRKAFDEHETKLERLGAVHLLSHGISAFKVDSLGARTDLVIPDRSPGEAATYATGIVLTEWKKALDENDANAKFEQARAQAELYADGALASIELRRTRYAVVVTLARMTRTPPDKEIGGIGYRYVNLAIEHDSPSSIARPKRGSRH